MATVVQCLVRDPAALPLNWTSAAVRMQPAGTITNRRHPNRSLICVCVVGFVIALGGCATHVTPGDAFCDDTTCDRADTMSDRADTVSRDEYAIDARSSDGLADTVSPIEHDADAHERDSSGLPTAGYRCTLTEGCAAGSVCLPFLGVPEWYCRPCGTAGTFCCSLDSAGCAAGLTCIPSGSEGREGYCVDPAGIPGASGSSCELMRGCSAPDLGCVDNPDGGYVCIHFGGAGEYCLGDRCPPGFHASHNVYGTCLCIQPF